MTSKNAFYIVLGVSLFIFSTAISYFIFSPSSPITRGIGGTKPTPTSIPTPTPISLKSKLDPKLPKTEVCPINGALFTKQERDVWETRRPLGVMIENSVDARPQSGLSSADLVYEAVAEGGITRFMGIYHCEAALLDNIVLAPVRSARIYFVNLISEYDGLYNHVGGAGNCDDPNVDPRAKALCLIKTAKIKDLDQFGRAGDFKTCRRLSSRLDKPVAYEHTMACYLQELYNVGAKWGWTNVDEKKVPWDKNFVQWKFQGTGQKAAGEKAQEISYFFWTNPAEFQKNFDVMWKFDESKDTYFRYTGGEAQKDLNTDQPLGVRNVVVQFAKETRLGDLERHNIYDIIGTGKALVFQNGVVTQANWSKPSRTARTIYKDSKGKEIQFTPGQIWISIVPTGNEVTYR